MSILLIIIVSFIIQPLNNDASVRVLKTNQRDDLLRLSVEFECVRSIVLDVANSSIVKCDQRFYKNELDTSELSNVKKRLNGKKKNLLRHAYSFIQDRIDCLSDSGCTDIFLRASTGKQNETCRTQELHRDKFNLDDDEPMLPLLEKGVVVSRFLTIWGDEHADSTVILNPSQSVWSSDDQCYKVQTDQTLQLFSAPLGDVVRFTPAVLDLFDDPRSGKGQPTTFHRAPVEKRGLFLQAV